MFVETLKGIDVRREVAWILRGKEVKCRFLSFQNASANVLPAKVDAIRVAGDSHVELRMKMPDGKKPWFARGKS